MAIIISIGKWGNVYFYRGFVWRLCLGWIAITFLPMDGDVILDWAASYISGLTPLQADAAGSGQAEQLELPAAQLKHDG